MLSIIFITCNFISIMILFKTIQFNPDRTPDKYEPVYNLSEAPKSFTNDKTKLKPLSYSMMFFVISYIAALIPFIFADNFNNLVNNFTIYVIYDTVYFITWGLISKSILTTVDNVLSISTNEIKIQSDKNTTSITPEQIKHIIKSENGSKYKITLENGHQIKIYTAYYFDNKNLHRLLNQFIESHPELDPTRNKNQAYRHISQFIVSIFIIAFTILLLVKPVFSPAYNSIYNLFLSSPDQYKVDFENIYQSPDNPENAWPYYVQAAKTYQPIDLDHIKKTSSSYTKELTPKQKEVLQNWIQQNTTSIGNLKRATGKSLCIPAYEDISFMEQMNYNDNIPIMDNGTHHLLQLYVNLSIAQKYINTSFDWSELYRSHLVSANAFLNQKTIMAKLTGIGLFNRSIKYLATNKSFTIDQIHQARQLLQSIFPDQIPPFSVNAEYLTANFEYDRLTNPWNLPIDSPFNKTLYIYGSRDHYISKVKSALEKLAKIKNVSDYKMPCFTIADPANITFDMWLTNDSKITIPFESKYIYTYKLYQRNAPAIPAANLILDLEEFNLTQGHYPQSLDQLKELGLAQHLPENTTPENTLIYSNDGSRATLYAFGKNLIDDHGISDKENKDPNAPDDIIYWQRTLTPDKIITSDNENQNL